jgi:hypothetical protein
MAAMAAMDGVVVPPLNFAMVAPGVYRSGYPNKRNFPFLRRLGLRSIMCVRVRTLVPSHLRLCRVYFCHCACVHEGVGPRLTPCAGSGTWRRRSTRTRS